MNRAPASAKINLALVVGPRREDGYHEVVTVLQRVALADRIAVEPAPALRVTGFAGDTLVRGALEALAERAGSEPAWHAAITKRIPVAAGLGGGSSDAATALRLANALLPEPRGDLHEIAAGLGADVPFFLTAGPQLGEGTGTTLRPVSLPADYWVVLVAPHGEAKASTADVYGCSRAETTSTTAAPPCSRRSREATWPACRRTTSRRRRSPPSCGSSARSEPTSPAPDRRSTASSSTAPTRPPRSAPYGARGAPG